MPNFTILSWYDPFELLCSLRPRLGLFKGREDGGTRNLTLRGPRANADDPDDELSYVNAKEGVRWPEAKALIERIRRDGERLIQGELEFGRIYFEMLDGGAVRHWRKIETPYSARFTRLYYCLRSNPGCMVYSGVESANLLPGQLVAINTRWCSAVNFGETARVYLVVDARAILPTRETTFHVEEAPERVTEEVA